MRQIYFLSYHVIDMVFYMSPLIMIAVVLLAARKINGKKMVFIKYCCLCLGILQVVLLALFTVEFVTIYLPYQKGEINSVCGRVTMLTTNGWGESFEIDGVHFDYDGRGAGLGYKKRKEDGGVIQHNGQQLQIDYVETSDRNVIVAIWE